jgi:hypothetical protein
MVKKVLSILLSLMMLIGASLVAAGGAPVAPGCGPYASGPVGPYGPVSQPYSNYWGDAPFPGLCGGVVALPFLVVGSLLGGNTVAPPPYPGPGMVGYNCAPRPCPPAPCAPYPQPLPRPYSVSCAPAPPCGTPFNGGVFSSGLPCIDVCAGLLGAVTGGAGLVP